jgi:hypothetical protein
MGGFWINCLCVKGKKIKKKKNERFRLKKKINLLHIHKNLTKIDRMIMVYDFKTLGINYVCFKY